MDTNDVNRIDSEGDRSESVSSELETLLDRLERSVFKQKYETGAVVRATQAELIAALDDLAPPFRGSSLSVALLEKILGLLVTAGVSLRELLPHLAGYVKYAGTLAEILGSGAIPVLRDALADPARAVRDVAAFTLGSLDPDWRRDPRTSLGALAHLAPADWPGQEPRIQPGNLSLFAGTEDGLFHPFRSAPRLDGFGTRGGVIYLPGRIEPEAWQGLLGFLLHPGEGERQAYAVFAESARDPETEGYLIQLRIVLNDALRDNFRVDTSADPYGRKRQPPLMFPWLQQVRTVAELLWSFILHQQAMWGTSFNDPRAPYGLMGGHEDAREELAFGLMTEWQGVYRIWSRAVFVEN